LTKLVSVLTSPAVGGTFLAWSLEYLAGHKSMYNVFEKKYIDINTNILNNANAHEYKSNQLRPRHFEDKNRSTYCFEQVVQDLIKSYGNDFNVVYTHSHYALTPQLINDILEYTTYNISVRLPKYFVLYHGSEIKRADGQPNITLIPDFFADMQHITDIALKRELLALNFKPFDFNGFKSEIVGNNFNAFRMVGPDLWQNLNNTITDIMEYIEQPIQQNRIPEWLRIYEKWKELHIKRILWCEYFSEIIESILNGYDMDLERFNLDLFQEATILHELLYKHNLNLKTHKLFKFKNAKQLYNLLEPNIHKLTYVT